MGSSENANGSVDDHLARNGDRSMPGRAGRVVVVGVVLLTGGLLVGLAARPMWQDQEVEQRIADPSGITKQASCGPVEAERVDASKHVDGRPIRYTAAPPAFGDHRSRWDYFARNFYDPEDRPELAVLVHNLEHGYNILWYDEVAASNARLLARIQDVAESYDGGKRDPATALIAAPWTSNDGASFPDGAHFALTHWYADPTDRSGSRADEMGFTKYCDGLSEQVVMKWMREYPLKDSPEGFPGNM